jgi:hypothetical protein
MTKAKVVAAEIRHPLNGALKLLVVVVTKKEGAYLSATATSTMTNASTDTFIVFDDRNASSSDAMMIVLCGGARQDGRAHPDRQTDTSSADRVCVRTRWQFKLGTSRSRMTTQEGLGLTRLASALVWRLATVWARVLRTSGNLHASSTTRNNCSE